VPPNPKMRTDFGKSSRGKRSVVQPNTSRATRRLVAAPELMRSGNQLTMPRLDGVVIEHRFCSGDEPAVALVKALLQLDIAVPEDWEKAKRDPTAYAWLTLIRWIGTHGGQAISRRFGLTATITSRLDEYTERDGANPHLLYITVDSDRAGYVVLTPTLELLEKAHPRLPATFFHLFAGSLNKWIRVYDYRDAEERVAMLHEWVEGEADEDQYEIPNVEGCIPPSLKQRPLSNRSLGRIRSQAKGENVKAILDGVLDLERISEQAKRSELTDEMREEMSDMNPPLPGLLAVFRPEDAIEGCFDEEAQTMTELPPEPSVIIPLIADQQPSVQEAFHTLRIVCETLATASRLIDRMPGNEQWVVQE